MLTCNWRGKVGYGDIVSPICYAHNVANKLDTHVKLVFHWNHSSSHKICVDDPETLMERASFIFDHCIKSNVSLEHRYHSALPIHHDNYDFTDDLHNFWYSDQRHIGHSDIIVVNGTHHNMVTMAEYGKTWKDPIGEQGWAEFVSTLSKTHHVVDVSYRTPIKELVAVLQRAKVFVGYHGTAAWVAKFVQTPMVVFSNKVGLTQMSFSHAAVKTAMEPDFIDNIDDYITHSKKRLEGTLSRYRDYRLPENLVKSFVWT